MLYEINMMITQLADQIEIDEDTGEVLCDLDAIMEQMSDSIRCRSFSYCSPLGMA